MKKLIIGFCVLGLVGCGVSTPEEPPLTQAEIIQKDTGTEAEASNGLE